MKIVVAIRPPWGIIKKKLVTLKDTRDYYDYTYLNKSRFKTETHWEGIESYESAEETIEGIKDVADFVIGEPYAFRVLSMWQSRDTKTYGADQLKTRLEDKSGLYDPTATDPWDVLVIGTQGQPYALVVTVVSAAMGGGTRFTATGGNIEDDSNWQWDLGDFRDVGQIWKYRGSGFRILKNG